jgi:phage tail-like protein
MVNDASAQSETLYPLSFCYQVKWDKAVILFQEASGLQKLGNVTMKRGLFTSDNQGRAWFNEMTMNEPVTISLLDEHGSAIFVWTLANAWPAKITWADLKSEDNEVAVDTLEIAHGGVTIAFSK